MTTTPAALGDGSRTGPGETDRPDVVAPRRVGGRVAHMDALDGLRGLALVAVLLFHQGFAWASGGYVGLPLFFALSGFLITTLLASEHERSGSVDVHRFAVRRVRRLAPMSFLTVGLIAVAWLILHDELSASIRGDATASMLQVSNWWFVVDTTSYSDLFAAPTPYLHFWSLAIEVQLYVLWPIVLLFLLRRVSSSRRRLAVGVALLAACAASTFAMPSFDLVYYGTPVHAAEFLAGAVLALWMADRRIRHDAHASPLPESAAWLAAVAFVLVVVLGDTTQPVWRWGGLAVMGAAAAVLISGALRGGPLGRALSAKPLLVIGTWSYGLYLVHWPVYVFLTADSTGLPEWAVFPARIAVTVLIAVALGHLVELPIRRAFLLRSTPALLIGCVAFLAAGLLVAQATVGRESRPAYAADSAGNEPQVFMAPPTTPTGADTPTTGQPGIASAPQQGNDPAPATAEGTAGDSVGATDPAPVSVRPQHRVRVIGSTDDPERVARGLSKVRSAGVQLDDRRRAQCPIVPSVEVLDYGVGHITSMCPDPSTMVTTSSAGTPIEAYVVTVGRPDLAAYQLDLDGAVYSGMVAEGFLSRRLPVLARSLRAHGLPVLFVPDAGLSAEEQARVARMTKSIVGEDPGIHVGAALGTTAGATTLLDILGVDDEPLTPATIPESSPSSTDAAPTVAPVVLVVGDSTAASLARYVFEESHGGVQSISLAQDGCPLIPVERVRWWSGVEFDATTCPTVQDVTDYIHQYRPQVVVVMASLMEQAELRVPYGDWFTPEDTEFVEHHDAYLVSLQDAVASTGSVVAVFDSPPLGDGAFEHSAMGESDRIAAWNTEIDRWDAGWENVVRVPWSQWIAEEEDVVGGNIRDDAVHVDEAPAREIIRNRVLPLLTDLGLLRDHLVQIGCLADDGGSLDLTVCSTG